MNDVLTYKGYMGSVGYDARDDILHGRLLGVQDVITYEGSSIQELRKDFCDAVDDYLGTCEELGKQPETPFSGKFVLRVPQDLHANMAFIAKQRGKSLNAWITETLHEAIKGPLSDAGQKRGSSI